MKVSALSVVVSAIFLLTANCSQEGPGTGSSGSGGNGGSKSGGSGGSDESGGASGSGGSDESGGAGGSDESGGSGGNGEEGGAGGAGGKSGSGGTSTTKRDAAAAGGESGSGGSSPKGGSGSGGSQAKGGAGGGGVGTGGSGKGTGGGGPGTGGAPGTGGTTTDLLQQVVPDLAKGFYWEGSCMGNFDPGGHNCWMYDKSTTCPNGGIDRDVEFDLGGDPSKKYTVKIEVRGVIGTRCYQNGTRAATAAPKENDYNNWWYVGGQPYNSTGWWNTYELHVSPSTGDKDVYYFNASDNGGGSFCEREATYLVKYTASFKVVGAGSLQFRIHDNNCKAQQNCGSNIDPNSNCSPRTVDLGGMSPQPPAGTPAAKQPPANAFAKTYYPQWMWITATEVTAL
jgi:hypothetical protein